MQAVGGAVETDIGSDPFPGEQRIQVLGRRAIVIGPARGEGLEEFGLESGRGGHTMDSGHGKQAA